MVERKTKRKNENKYVSQIYTDEMYQHFTNKVIHHDFLFHCLLETGSFMLPMFVFWVSYLGLIICYVEMFSFKIFANINWRY